MLVNGKSLKRISTVYRGLLKFRPKLESYFRKPYVNTSVPGLRLDVIPIPISFLIVPSPLGEGWDEGISLKTYWDWYNFHKDNRPARATQTRNYRQKRRKCRSIERAADTQITVLQNKYPNNRIFRPMVYLNIQTYCQGKSMWHSTCINNQ